MVGSLHGKTVVITGASAGIGAAAARQFADLGANVVPIGRSPEKTAAVAREIGVEPLVCDFARFAGVRGLVDSIRKRCDRVDVFVHNAGGMRPERQITTDGHELTLQTNYLSPFLLQLLLQDQLTASRSMVVVTSSIAHYVGRLRLSDLNAHEQKYSMFGAYATSKLADLLFTRKLARSGMVAIGYDPGFVSTEFLVPVVGEGEPKGLHRVGAAVLPLTTPEIAGRGIVRLALLEHPERVSGRLTSRSRTVWSSLPSQNARLANALWEASLDLVN